MTTLVARPARARLTGQRHMSLARAHFRLVLLMLLFLGGIALIFVRLVWLTLFVEPAGPASAGSMLPPRADIVARNGEPLARTIDAWSVGVHPDRLLGDPADLARRLHGLMPERSAAEYWRILTSGKRFVYLRRRAMPELVAAVNALGEPAIAFAREPERLYPQTTLAAHVLGYTDFEGRGVAGIERALDARLSDPARLGQPVVLSIDSRVQAAMESELYAAMSQQRAEGATGLVLDVDTGEVIAMVSLPVYNPNKVGASPPDARRNNVTQSVYELGSTFKPLTIAQAIETGTVTDLGRRFDTETPLTIGRFRINDDHPQRRPLTMAETLMHSSNIATARIAEEMGRERMEALFRALNFDSPPDIELKEKGRTLWPVDWGRATTLTTGYGHGIAVTPLHLASAYAALVNGGIWRPATLLKVAPGKAATGRRVFSPETSARSREMLRLIVTDGTGRKADVPGFRVGGKTGTAEKPGVGGYSRSVNVSSFAAVFPMDRPRYVVLAMLDAPKGSKESFGLTTAAWTAAPVVARVIARAGPILGVIPDESRDVDLARYAGLFVKAKSPAEQQ